MSSALDTSEEVDENWVALPVMELEGVDIRKRLVVSTAAAPVFTMAFAG